LTKTGSNRFGSVFSFDSVLALFGSVFLFFRFGSDFSGFFFVWVWFFRFQAYKTETEPVGFFKILIDLIGFFSWFGFFGYCFSGFIGFSVFLLTLITTISLFVYFLYFLG